ncbi:MAG: OmpA family protein [Nitrospirota bacterium]
MSKNKSIVVKKVKKVAGGGHHGGSWKVAYADFVTAMMAFFLLLWLLSMVSDEKRVRLSAYFKYFSLYESGGTSWMEKSSEIFGEAGENVRKVFAGKPGDTIDNAEVESTISSIEETLKKDISDKLGDIKDQVLVDIVDDGIRIQMIDKEGSLMFERGSPSLTSKAKNVLKLISEDIKQYKNKVIIEGHTDSLKYAGSQYSNWELSTERASSARKELEVNGLDSKRITRVAGYADTDPLIKDNPEDPRNRRISITLSIPKVSKSKDNTDVTAQISSDEKQLKKVSEELRYMIDKAQIRKPDEKPQPVISAGGGADSGSGNNGEGQTIIRRQEWPAFRPIPKNELPAAGDDSSPAVTKNDYDSIIKEGQTSLQNGKVNPKRKAPAGPDAIKNPEDAAIKSEPKGPSVIRELSEPVITKDKLFTIIPGSK